MEMHRFFIPYKDNKNEDLPEEIRTAFIKEIKLRCCEVNDGFTVYEGQGGWLGENGIIEEPVTILETFGKNPLPKVYWQHYATLLKQECLLGVSGVEFNTTFNSSGVDASIYKNTKVLKIKDGKVISYRSTGS
jgi:hypothetical protein